MKDLIKVLVFLAIVTLVFMFLGTSLGINFFSVLSKITLVLDAFVLIGIVFKKFFT